MFLYHTFQFLRLSSYKENENLTKFISLYIQIWNKKIKDGIKANYKIRGDK